MDFILHRYILHIHFILQILPVIRFCQFQILPVYYVIFYFATFSNAITYSLSHRIFSFNRKRTSYLYTFAPMKIKCITANHSRLFIQVIDRDCRLVQFGNYLMYCFFVPKHHLSFLKGTMLAPNSCKWEPLWSEFLKYTGHKFPWILKVSNFKIEKWY